jgi:hypothetical protein
MNGSKLIPFMLVCFVFTFLALGLASAQTTTTTPCQNVPSANNATNSTTTPTSTTTSTETVTTFTDSNGVVHHAYNVTVTEEFSFLTSATATVTSATVYTLPDAHPDLFQDYVSDYLSYVGAGIILTTFAALIYYKVPHPAKTSKVKQILD